MGTDAFLRPPSPERIRRGVKVFSNKRGPVGSPELWAWSSYRYYFLGEAGPVQINVGCGEISFRDRIAQDQKLFGIGSILPPSQKT